MTFVKEDSQTDSRANRKLGVAFRQTYMACCAAMAGPKLIAQFRELMANGTETIEQIRNRLFQVRLISQPGRHYRETLDRSAHKRRQILVLCCGRSSFGRMVLQILSKNSFAVPIASSLSVSVAS